MVKCKEDSSGVSCLWSGYSVWSGCSATCGVGKKVRTRRVLQKAGEGGEVCQGGARDESLSVSPLSCGLSMGTLWIMEYLLTDMWRGNKE